MSKIVKLDPTYALWLTYSWSMNNHGICGHTFEVIDYFHILKHHFKVGILLAEDITWETFEMAIRAKYTFTDDEIAHMKQHTVFENRPRLIVGTNILFVDGGVINTSSVMMYFEHIMYFACGNREIKNNTKPNVYVMQDYRVYEPVLVNGIDYKKRILFDKLKPIGESKDSLLVYATKNCREFNAYQELEQYGKHILAITNKENRPLFPIDGVTFVIPPVPNIFEQFSAHVYTPVQRKWDCSPRFIAECKFYGKQVFFHNIDYWQEDHGLRWRVWDMDNDFDSLFLREDDQIVDLIKRIINDRY